MVADSITQEVMPLTEAVEMFRQRRRQVKLLAERKHLVVYRPLTGTLWYMVLHGLLRLFDPRKVHFAFRNAARPP